MSSHLGDQREAPRNVFRGADGNELLLDQDSHTNPNTSGILKFVLHNNSRSHLRANLAILFVTLLLWLSRFPSTLIIFLLAVLIFRVKLMVAAVRSGLLLFLFSFNSQVVKRIFGDKINQIVCWFFCYRNFDCCWIRWRSTGLTVFLEYFQEKTVHTLVCYSGCFYQWGDHTSEYLFLKNICLIKKHIFEQV